MPWQISASILHDATHKFCKSIDVHCISPGLCTSVQTFGNLITRGQGSEALVVQLFKVMAMQDKPLLLLSPEALLNNADSCACFIMLIGE